MQDFFLFVILGPLVGFFVYYLCEDRKRSDEYHEELRRQSRLTF